MTSVRPCGCTYRDTGSSVVIEENLTLIRAVRFLLIPAPRNWGEICNLLRCNTYGKRDELHRILHRIADPSITPTEGRGRKGTLWQLK